MSKVLACLLCFLWAFSALCSAVIFALTKGSPQQYAFALVAVACALCSAASLKDY